MQPLIFMETVFGETSLAARYSQFGQLPLKLLFPRAILPNFDIISSTFKINLWTVFNGNNLF